MILGIDEAGRGPWAGPLVVGAVVLPNEVVIDGLTDSKKLTAKRRELLEPVIKEAALGYGLGWVHADELDEVGMSEALRRATRRAVENIKTPYHEIIIDGTVNFLKDTPLESYVATLPKADSLIPAVSAASVLAKVARDRFMAEQDDIFPGYNFAKHAGYGTAAHQAAIKEHGVTVLHRLSFKPLQAHTPSDEIALPRGAQAEAVVAADLVGQGHTILDQNWRTKLCEIDIVSKRDDTYYFVEVKHRRDDTGLDAITPRKRAKMKLGAVMYQARHQLTDENLQLLVATTTGDPIRLTGLLPIE